MKELKLHIWILVLVNVCLLIGCSDNTTVSQTATQTRGPEHSNTPPVPSEEHLPSPTMSLTPLSTTTPQTLTNTPTRTPTIPPSPTTALQPVLFGQIAFVDVKNNNISLMTMQESELETVTEIGSYVVDALAWSPDAHWIAFGNSLSDDDQLYLIKTNGEELRQITNTPHSKYHLSWSVDGKSLVYVDDGGTGLEGDLVIVNVDTGKTQKLTHTSGLESNPAWSPDGKMLAFLYREDISSNAYLYVMTSDGNQRQQVSDIVIELGRLSWSPNGNQIAFSAGKRGCGEIHIINVDGSDMTQLTSQSGCAYNPSWSPDGDHIVFSASDKERGDVLSRNWQIYVMNIDGSGIRQLTESASMVPLFPTWSPVPALVVDSDYVVTEAGNKLNLRETASLDGTVLQLLESGDIITILEGPVDVDDSYWWRIRTSDGVEGWVVEVAGWYSRIE